MSDFSTIPNDDELRLRIKNLEDHFVERKTLGDSKDWLKTAVAFANSAPIGFPAVLYLGVRDGGTPEPHAADSNLENFQASFARKVKAANPRIAYYPRVFRINDQQVLAAHEEEPLPTFRSKLNFPPTALGWWAADTVGDRLLK